MIYFAKEFLELFRMQFEKLFILGTGTFALSFITGFFGAALLDLFATVRWRFRKQRVKRPIPSEAERASLEKLAAKKLNEHIKLFGSFCNTVGAAVVGAAFIIPYIGNHAWPDQDKLWWVGAGLALPVAGHIALRFMKSES